MIDAVDRDVIWSARLQQRVSDAEDAQRAVEQLTADLEEATRHRAAVCSR